MKEKFKKLYDIIEFILVCFVLLSLTLGLFFYGLLVNFGIMETQPLESYEVSGFFLMGTGMFFLLFFFVMNQKKITMEEKNDESKM